MIMTHALLDAFRRLADAHADSLGIAQTPIPAVLRPRPRLAPVTSDTVVSECLLGVDHCDPVIVARSEGVVARSSSVIAYSSKLQCDV
jgi:hypothetical protein